MGSNYFVDVAAVKSPIAVKFNTLIFADIYKFV